MELTKEVIKAVVKVIKLQLSNATLSKEDVDHYEKVLKYFIDKYGEKICSD